jgi:thiamine-monophosphate kinase
VSSAKGEFALIDRIRRRAGSSSSQVATGIGDDMAWLKLAEGNVLVSCDLLLDGVHFETGRHDPSMIGRKAVACSLSDIAAMAAKPVGAVVSVALPTCWSIEQAEQLHHGAIEIGEAHGCPIVGGDTTSWDRGLAINITAMATPDGIGPILRSAARVGDDILVTGRLGGSRLGRHLNFEPRISEARDLAASGGIHAMIDISDGISSDLAHICFESGLGAVLERSALENVISDAARQMAAKDGRSPLEHALHDGEDFELLMATDVELLPTLQATRNVPDCGLHRLGQFRSETGIEIRESDGRLSKVEPRGWRHFQ